MNFPTLTRKKKSPASVRKRLILACGFIITILCALLAAFHPPILLNLEARFYDSVVPGGPPPKGYAPPVVVAVDDASLSRIGRWPWPRSVMARLLSAIAAQHPASVGIDAIFAEPERAPGLEVADPTRPSAGDVLFAEALKSAPFVLGYEFTFGRGIEGRETPLLHPLKTVLVREKGDADPTEGLWRPSGVVSSLPVFARSVALSGFVNAAMEHGGILRRMPVLMEKDGKLYPSLALATVLRARGGGALVLSSTWSGAHELEVGAERIPLDERGRLLLRYRQWYGSGTPISAAKLLDGRVPPDTLRGRIVFLGATAIGMGEAVATPLSSMMSGVQIHALTADNMLRTDFVRQASWPWRVLAVLILGGAATVLSLSGSVVAAGGSLALLAAAFWGGMSLIFRSEGVLLSPVFPVLVLSVDFALLTVLRSFYLEKGVRRQKHDLDKARDLIMTSLASLTEIRDVETGAHVMRCEHYLALLCGALARFPRYSFLDKETIELVSKLAPLHDIGKVGLPDQLLRKAAGFTPEEYQEVKRHTIYGRDAIAKAAARVGVQDDELIRYAKEIIYCHHERWDGSGYPEGLKGEAIPWVGRVMALVDAYDAMVTQRVYNKPVSHDDAVQIIIRGKEVLFDPDVVEAFLAVEDEWVRVARELREG